MSPLIYVYFMPWLEIYKSITLGEITFWSFSRESEERIEDIKLKKRLESHFESYRNSNGSLNPITICSFQGKTFYDNLNENEFNHLREAITALAFASTIEKIEARIQNPQERHVPPSMNSFDLISRRLDISSKNYFHVSLSLIDLEMTEGNIFFQKPLAARGDAYPSGKWVKYLNAYLALKDSSKLRNRITRSLEFFRIAQAQDDLKDNLLDSAFLTRVVLLATAFESLIFPEGKKQVVVNGKSVRRGFKAEFFANYIDERFKLANSKRSKRILEKYSNRNPRKDTFISAAWWAYDFYKLRNSIVHGDEVSFSKLISKKRHSQMDIACLVFADCLEEIIRAKKLIKFGRKRIDWIINEIDNSMVENNWKKHHKVLGWVR